MTLYDLIKKYRHRDRVQEIIHVFFEEEFGFFISKINLQYHLPFHKRIKALVAREKIIDHPVRLRRAFERLGPTFIKFGQLLSLRPDLIPPEFVEEFEKMQDHVPPVPFSEAKKIIETELKQPISKIFTSFEKTPLASASISQVYKAKLGNKVVAVKVQRPGIAEKINNDLEIMYDIVDLLEENIPDFKTYRLKTVVHEFEKWTLKELNFNIEAYYAQQIQKNFKDSKILKVPDIYSKLSTSKVLVMEFLDGVPLHDLDKIKKKNIDLKKVIRNGYYVVLKQVFVDGFFHADPHPGNILVMSNNRIGLIDFGILGHFDKKLKRDALDILRTLVNNDPEKAVEILIRMNPQSDIDKESFTKDVRDVFEHLKSTPMEQLQIGPLLRELIVSANRHNLIIPPDFVLYGKTIAILEGIALRYEPKFEFFKETKDTLSKLLNVKFFANEIYERSKYKVSEYTDLINNFPSTASEILSKAKNFKLNIDIEDADIKNLSLELEHSSGNIAVGFIIAALIVSSALVTLTESFTYLTMPGLIIAGILGLWLAQRTIFAKVLENIRI